MELLSFIYWEIKYTLSFYKKNDIIQFLETDPLCEFKHIKQEINIVSSGYKVTNNKYNWSRRYDWTLPRHSANKPGSNGQMEYSINFKLS